MIFEFKKYAMIPLMFLSVVFFSNNVFAEKRGFEERLYLDKEATEFIFGQEEEEIEKRKMDEKLKDYYSLDKRELDNDSSEGLVLRISLIKEIKGTVLDRFIQNNKLVTASKINFKNPYVFLKTKTLNFENKQLEIIKPQFGKKCLHFNDSNLNLKFCNFKNVKELKHYTSNFFEIDGFTIKIKK